MESRIKVETSFRRVLLPLPPRQPLRLGKIMFLRQLLSRDIADDVDQFVDGDQTSVPKLKAFG
jgi:hypothetical protein